MFRFAAILILVGCASIDAVGRSAEIAWDPPDEISVKELADVYTLLDDESSNFKRVEAFLNFDPLRFVPDQRFAAAFPAIHSSDRRIFHCRLGISGITTIEFEPDVLSSNQVTRKSLSCQNSDGLRVSMCKLTRPISKFVGNPNSFYVEYGDLRIGNIEELVSSLVDQSLVNRSGAPIPEQLTGGIGGLSVRTLSASRDTNIYEVALPGCGCNLHLEIVEAIDNEEQRFELVRQSEVCH